MDTLTRMQAFVRVADAGGFSAAARKLGRSKALLSKYVRELEDDLGVRLLNRTTRQLSLTEAGSVYLREANEILQRIDDLEAMIHDTHREPRGHLRVTAPRTLGDGELGRAVMEFLQREPKISVDLFLDDRFVDLVEEAYDVAIRVTDLADSSLIARKLAPFRLVVCAHPDVVAAAGRLDHPNALADLPCIVDTNAKARGNWAFRVDGERLTVAVKGRIEVNSPQGCRLAALAGLGFAYTPFVAVHEDLAAGRLVAVLEGFEHGQAAIYAVYPHRRHLSGKVRAFVDHLVGWFGRAEPQGGAG
jgi:DNA-binding transcriptional LysR family regulator